MLSTTASDTLASTIAASSQAEHAALLFGQGESLSYRALNSWANQIAHWLLSQNVARGEVVALQADRSPEFVAAALAIVKAGAAYLPLDPDLPSERLRHVLEESEVRVLLAGAGQEVDGRGRCLDLGNRDLLGTVSTQDPGVDISGSDPSYVLYTSGSTGRPKGVVNTHQGVVNRIRWMQDVFGLTPEDRVLMKTPVSFDVSVWEVFGALTSGATLVIAEPGGHKDPGYLIESIGRHQVTTLHFVPSMLRLFLEHPEAGECHSLRRVWCGGESLTGELRDRFFEVLDAELHHCYGPTEAAIDVTHRRCRRGPGLRIEPIGRPVPNTDLHIVDENGEPLGPGEVGELWIGGIQVAAGYLNRPDLTAEAFIEDPFTPGSRVYRSGDLARWLPDGSIEFLGRADFQVKVRGVRIELGEIEALLLEHPEVRAAAVTTEGDDHRRRLVAYVVGDVTAGDLRTHLRDRLPETMMPALFDFRDYLPLTTSGKIDRLGLTRNKERPRLDNEYIPPRDDLEIYLANTWQRIIAVEPVGIHDRFFDLGGDSLRAIEFHSELEAKLEIPVSATALFEAPTIADLSALLQSAYPEPTERVFGVAGGSGQERERPSRRQQPNRRQVALRAGHRRGRGET